MIILNGGMSATTVFDESALALTGRSHLVLTEIHRPRIQPMPEPHVAAHIISVSVPKGQPERITLDIQAS
jgi:hypothetical protein